MQTCEYAGKTLVAERDLSPGLFRLNHWVDRETGDAYHIVFGPERVEEPIAAVAAVPLPEGEKITLLPTHLVDGETPVVESIGKDGVARYFTIEGNVKGRAVSVKGRELTPFPNRMELPDATDMPDMLEAD